MAFEFEQEIIRLLANRSVYLDFSHRGNAGAVDWPDDLVKCFGKTPDQRGDYPVEGTVMGFGNLQRGVSNVDFTLEIPNVTIELIDPDNFWRTRAEDPINLLYRWVQLWLRVGRSLEQPVNTAVILPYWDQRISTGQITKVTFQPAKKVSLECQLTGGKWLGEMIPRRTITLTDFPRCAQENLGKAVPIVFGRFSNIILADGKPIEQPPGACQQKVQILLQESWANGNGTAFATGAPWEANMGPGTGFDPPDPLYPTLAESVGVRVIKDHPLWGYGVNMLWTHPNVPDWTQGGVAFRQFDSGLPDFPNGAPGGSYRPFDATEMWTEFTYFPDAAPMRAFELFAPLYTVWEDYGYYFGVEVTAVDYYYTQDNTFVDASATGVAWVEVNYQRWNGTEEALDRTYFPWGNREELIDKMQTFTICHRCGSYSHNGTGQVNVASDGYIYVFVNGVIQMASGNFPLTMAAGWYLEPGRDRSNYCQTVSFGWYGMVGPMSRILVTNGIDEVPPESPCTEAPSIQQASGALGALLVDTGQKPVNPGFIDSPFVPVASMPKVSGHQAHNVWGGGTIKKAVFFYVAARKVTGEIGPISTIVDLDNDYDPGQAEHAAELSWHKAADATAYVVWMTQDPNFHPVDRPNQGSPRTKTIDAANGSQFPPDWTSTPFDYSIRFTSLLDGMPFGGAGASSTGYRYLLAGHALKSVDQVYVLKPMPTIKNDAPKNVLIADVGVGSGQIRVAYNKDDDDVERFQKDNVIIITGDPLPYTILKSHEGLHDIAPPTRRAFTTGTVVAKATDVDTEVLQREGQDYRQEIIEVNGNRYHTLVFTLPQQNAENCTQYPVSANVQGSELNADGTGFLIDHGVSVMQHFFKNWIFNDYRSSIGPFSDGIYDGQWFQEVAYQPGLINNDSFYAANLVASGRINNSYKGAGALTEQIPVSQLIYDLISSFDLDLYYDSSTGVGAWSVAMLSPSDIVRANVDEITPEVDILRDTFGVEYGTTPHANVLPWVAGVLTGQVVGQADGFLLAGEVQDAASIEKWGRIVAEPLQMPWVRDPSTAYDVAMHRLWMMRHPPVHAACSIPVGRINDSLCTVVAVSHPDGLGPNGWVKRLCRVMRSDVDLDRMVLHLLLRDIDPLVGP